MLIYQIIILIIMRGSYKFLIMIWMFMCLLLIGCTTQETSEANEVLDSIDSKIRLADDKANSDSQEETLKE